MNGLHDAVRAAMVLPKVGDQSKAVGQLPEVLDEFQVGLVRQALPAGSEIVGLKPVTPVYRYPLLVEARVPGAGAEGGTEGETVRVELHAYAWHLDSAEREAALLPVLAEMGLPVAKVLAGPAVHPGYPQVGPMVVQSHLPGEFLPFVRATAEQLDKTCRLMLEGIARLRGLTGALEQHPVGKSLPRRTLVSLLEGIVSRGGPWLEEPVFRRGVEVLGPVLRAVKTPLVFSNGLNISWNFKWDGEKLTGFHRFARACFEDPHIQFAKYKIWAIDDLGWGPFARAGFVERYLYEQNVAKSEFASRLALQCLWRLQEAIPVSGQDEEWGRERESCLSLLEESLAVV